MLPVLPIAAGMAGVTALNDMTTGREQQNRDAILKATAYRMNPYSSRIDPEKFAVYQTNPVGRGLASGASAASLVSGINRDEAAGEYLAAKAAQSNAQVDKDLGRMGTAESLAMPEMGARKQSPYLSLMSSPESGPSSSDPSLDSSTWELHQSPSEKDRVYRLKGSSWNSYGSPYTKMKGYA